MRLVMHIGPHKTATSYLQQNFYRNRSKLLTQGWLYPSTSERVRTAHHDIADLQDKILSDTHRQVRRLRAVGEAANRSGQNVLLSAEGFRHWKPAHFERIRQLMQASELHLVYTIRDPLSHFYSHWAQRIKNGAEEALPDFHARHFGNPLTSELLNPVVELGPLIKAPDVTATVLLYDEIMHRKLDIFTVFSEHVLKVKELVPVTVAPQNLRLPIELTEFIRTLAPMARLPRSRSTIKLGKAVDWFLSSRFKQNIVDTIREDAGEARRTLVVPRTSPGLAEVEKQIVEVFGSILCPQPESNNLFPAREAAWIHYDAEALRQHPHVRPLLDRALKRTRPGSPWIRCANATYALTIAVRQWRRRLF